MTQNWLIRGARIVDGTGAPWFRGDVRVVGGRIDAVARISTPGPAQRSSTRRTATSRPASSMPIATTT
jgi:N-acyl-D-aspartate/D-glutamate deacylase